MPGGPRIVVGVDGSRGSAAAVRWAAEQCRVTGSPVDAVYVLEPIVPLDFTGAGFTATSQLDPSHLHRTAHDVMRRVIMLNAPELVDVVHQVVVEHANPGQALLRAAQGTAMLVVGAHHHSGLGFLLGSTAASCVRHATCPVVVIPEDWRMTAAVRVDDREEVLTSRPRC